MSGYPYSPPGVRLTSVFKRYTKNSVVLNGLNMTVKKATIYGLLGPSGCGKTTLLSCIVGRTRIDSGEIHLAFKHKKQLGYMPQETSLSPEFTIEESFIFYGTIFAMTREQIEQRIKVLSQLLELPPLDRNIKNCSGGQQRRISLGITLFHDPELLILDEPTVGVDPVLSHKIWKHMMEIVSKEGKTIIITTHYIEEAKNAHCIGLMRNGILLAENSPGKLMAQENSSSLEETFLKLSQKQHKDEIKQDVKEEEEKDFYPEGPQPPLTFPSSEKLNKHRFLAQMRRSYVSALRDWSCSMKALMRL